MSNLFQEVLNDAQGVEQKLLGPTYPYYKNIKTPSQIGMSDRGTLQQMGRNIDGLIQYVQVLVSGKSGASTTGGPLGNKFFLKTGAKCAAIDKCTNKFMVLSCLLNHLDKSYIHTGTNNWMSHSHVYKLLDGLVTYCAHVQTTVKQSQ